MAQQNEPLVQPEELDMPDDEVLYLSLIHI